MFSSEVKGPLPKPRSTSTTLLGVLLGANLPSNDAPPHPTTPDPRPLHVTAELHHSCTVSSPIFDNAFHYSLSPSHLQKPIRKTVQFLVDIARRLIVILNGPARFFD